VSFPDHVYASEPGRWAEAEDGSAGSVRQLAELHADVSVVRRIEFDRRARVQAATKAFGHVAMTGVATGSGWTGAVLGGGSPVTRIVDGTSLGFGTWRVHRD